MDGIEKALSGIDGGRILDVATQAGGFVRIMKEHLKSYTEIVGIDLSEPAIEAARKATDEDGISFMVMDAEKLEFEDESFDTVSISVSLHHMADVAKVLGEMKRVLRPRGHFIAMEMHSDAETEPERTAAGLHRWAAEIDTALGRLHNPIMGREEIVGHVAGLGLTKVESHDWIDRESDPLEAATVERLENAVTRMTERAAEATDPVPFEKQGEELLERIRKVGARMEPMIVITGQK